VTLPVVLFAKDTVSGTAPDEGKAAKLATGAVEVSAGPVNWTWFEYALSFFAGSQAVTAQK